MRAVTTLISGLALLASVVLPAVADRFEDISLEQTQVGGNVYALIGVNGFAGGNIGVSVGEDGVLIVDDQYRQMHDKIDRALGKISKGKLKYILNTHWHGDHTDGNRLFGTEATIIAHDNVRQRLMHAQVNDFGKTPASPKSAWPVITFAESVSIHFNGEEIKMWHLPGGHTDGDGVVYFTGSNVIHLGDLFFAGDFPFIDLHTGGNALQFEKNVAELIKTLPEDIKIIPGHGPLANMSDLKAYHTMLKTTIDEVREHRSAGKSLAQVQAAGFKQDWSDWADGFIDEPAWIAIIYKSLD